VYNSNVRRLLPTTTHVAIETADGFVQIFNDLTRRNDKTRQLHFTSSLIRRSIRENSAKAPSAKSNLQIF
jgi:hypothetical protein